MGDRWAKTILAFALALGAVALFFKLPGGEAPADQFGPSSGSGGLSAASPREIARGPAEGAADGHGHDTDAPHPMELTYGFDVFDKRKLVGYSEYVFVARVEEKVGARPTATTIPGDPGIPHEQFSVEVREVLKGDLRTGARRVVSQIGGTDAATGLPNAVVGVYGEKSGVDAPLVPGDLYVLAAERDPTDGWLALAAQPSGAVPVTDNPGGKQELIEFREAARGNPPSPIAAVGGR